MEMGFSLVRFRAVPLLFWVGITLSLFMGSTSDAALTTSPTLLLHALAKTTYPRTQLPAGYTSAKVGNTGKLAGPSPGHTLLGTVGFAVQGPNADGLVYYSVYPNANDARAIETDPILDPGMRIIERSVPGFKLPGLTLTIPTTGTNSHGKTVAVTLTVASVAQGNVVAIGATVDQANSHVERPLLQSAVRHLLAIEAKLSAR